MARFFEIQVSSGSGAAGPFVPVCINSDYIVRIGPATNTASTITLTTGDRLSVPESYAVLTQRIFDLTK